jgi:hypothetical protein
MTEQSIRNIALESLCQFQTDAKYLVMIELVINAQLFRERVEAQDQAVTKLMLFQNLLVSLELYKSIKNLTYKRTKDDVSFALLIEGDALEEIIEFIDELPKKMDFVTKTDLLEIQVRNKKAE